MATFPRPSFANPIAYAAGYDRGLKQFEGYIAFSIGIPGTGTDKYLTKNSNGDDVTISIKDGLATFSFPQTHWYVGIGDKVIYGAYHCYLNKKIDDFSWIVTKDNGDMADNVSSTVVTSIDKTFSSLSSAINGSSSGIKSLIGTSDLAILKKSLFITCYKMIDPSSSGTISVTGWTINEHYKIKIFSPDDLKNHCNYVHHHHGFSGTGYRLALGVNLSLQDHTDIDGVQLIGGKVQTLGDGSVVTRNIINGNSGIGIQSDKECFAGWNCISNCTNAIELDPINDFAIYSNNFTLSNYGVYFNSDPGATGNFKNNIFQDIVTNSSNYDKVFMCNNISNLNDLTAGADNHHIDNITILDNHLNNASDINAVSGGISLEGDTNFSVIKDIDGKNYDDTWSIGCHHYTRLLCISVGNTSTILLTGGTCTLTHGVASFSASESYPLSPGDIITGGSFSYAISGPVTGGGYFVTKLDGSFPADDSFTPTVKRRCSNLNDVIKPAGLIDSLLTYSDLTLADLQVAVYCNPINDTTNAESAEFDCDNTRFITIKAQITHKGVWSTDYYRLSVATGIALSIEGNCFIVDGLQVSSEDTKALTITNSRDWVFKNNIIKGAVYGIDSNDPVASENISIINNLIYDSNYGIYLRHANTTINYHIYNNTILSCDTGMFLGVEYEYVLAEETNSFLLKNNLVLDCEDKCFSSNTIFPKTIFAISNWSGDDSIADFSGKLNEINKTVLFKDHPNKDFHISLYSSLQMKNAVRLDSDQYYNFTYDYEGEIRNINLKWDIGCDGIGAAKTKELHVSCGNKETDYTGVNIVKIINGIAFFDNDIDSQDVHGAGDKIECGLGNFFISEYGNSKTVRITTTTGTTPGDTTTSTAVSKIKRDKNVDDMLSEVNGYVGYDLITLLLNLFIHCYNEDQDPFSVSSSWLTNSNYKIKINTPYLNSECPERQRHNGVYGEGTVIIASGSNNAISIETGFVKIEGFCLKASTGNPININNGSEGVDIQGNVISGGSTGIHQAGSSKPVNISSNIVYNQTVSGIVIENGSAVNNTVIVSGSANGIVNTAGCDVINNIVQAGTGDCFSSEDGTLSCISSDDTSGNWTTEKNRINVSLSYINTTENNYHLARKDILAIGWGIDASEFTNYDINGKEIIEWSIGAHCPVFGTRKLYFSVGKRTIIQPSSAKILSISSGIIEFNEELIEENIGIGDRIVYNDTNECYLGKKITSTKWEVKDKFGEIPEDVLSPDFTDITKAFSPNIVNPASLEEVFNGGIKSIQRFLTLGTDDVCTQFTDLTKAKFQINIAVYQSSYTNQVRIGGSTDLSFQTDENHFLNIFVPTNTNTDCVKNQGHKGKSGNSGVIISPSNKEIGVDYAIQIENDYVIFDGFNIQKDYAISGIGFKTCTKSKVINCISSMFDYGLKDEAGGNIFLNCLALNSTIDGIVSAAGTHVYNCTSRGSAVNGVNNNASSDIINIISQKGTTGSAFTNSNVYYCVADDSSPSAVDHHNTLNATLHWLSDTESAPSIDAEYKGTGKDLSFNNLHPFKKDAIGTRRDRFWDPGFLEYKALKTAVYSVEDNLESTNTGGTLLTASVTNKIIKFNIDQDGSDISVGDKVYLQEVQSKIIHTLVLVEKIDNKNWMVDQYDITSFLTTSIPESFVTIRRSFTNLVTALEYIQNVYDIIGPESGDTFKDLGINIKIAFCGREYVYPEEKSVSITLYSDCDHTLSIFSPIDTEKDCNIPLRHAGKFDSTKGFVSGKIRFAGTDYVGISGLQFGRYIEGYGHGIIIDNCNSYHIDNNIFLDINGDAINVIEKGFSTSSIINNFIDKTSGDGIKITCKYVGYINTIIANNTITKCQGRGFYLYKPEASCDSTIRFNLLNNIFQKSGYVDCTEDNPNKNVFVYNCISSDNSLSVFFNDDNYIWINRIIKFIDEGNGNGFIDATFDAMPIDSALDLSSIPSDFGIGNIDSFNTDIGLRIRSSNKWDVGAYEKVKIIGTGNLETAPIDISAMSSTYYNNSLTVDAYLRNEYTSRVSTTIQALNFEDLIPLCPVEYNVNIYVQGGGLINNLSGDYKQFSLGNRGKRFVKIMTDPEEQSLGPAKIVIPDGFNCFDSESKQGLLDISSIYIVQEGSQCLGVNISDVRIINSIIETAHSSLFDEQKGMIQILNTEISFASSIQDASISDTILGSIPAEKNIRLFDNNDINMNFSGSASFITCPDKSGDTITNCNGYNNAGSFEFLNIEAMTTKKCISSFQDFSEPAIENKPFLPTMFSPLIDAGNNNKVNGNEADPFYPQASMVVKTDIIGNKRKRGGFVDIGPYEIKINSRVFTSNQIKEIFQDKLYFSILYGSYPYPRMGQSFRSTYGDVIYNDLYYTFPGDESQMDEASIEYARESKIIIQLKPESSDYNIISDKKNEYITEFTAHFDSGLNSIVVMKINDIVGDVFKNMFMDNRYIFDFNEKTSKLYIYLNPTYNMGVSGSSHPINNVKFGGSPILGR